MTHGLAGPRVPGAIAAGRDAAARWLAALCMALGSSGCLLTTDLPDPALDVPPGYKSAGTKNPMNAPPTLDWWRGFRSRELTTLMEEAQTVNLDIAAATARFIQADAQARIAGAPLLPALSGTGSETYSRTSGSSASGLTNGGREVVNYNASLSASYELDFWGKNRDAAQAAEETAIANRFDRDVVALTTLTSVANAYFQVLAAQDRLRTAQRNIASAQRILDAIKQRLSAGTGTDLDVAQQESVLANQRALVPPLRQTLEQNINALATLVSRPPESINVAGGSLNRIAIPRVTPGLPSEILTQRPTSGGRRRSWPPPPPTSAMPARNSFPSIQLTGQGGYQSSALVSLFQPHAAFFSWSAARRSRSSTAARSSAISNSPRRRQDELLQTYRKTVVQAFADVDNALTSISETTDQAAAAARRRLIFAAGLPAGRATSCGRERPTS